MSDDLQVLADESAADARAYLSTVTEVASGTAPDAAIPIRHTTSLPPMMGKEKLPPADDYNPIYG